MKRKIIVEFRTADGIKRLDGINVRFSCTKFMSGVCNEAQIDIWNLTRDDINYLTTYTSEFMAIQQRKTITIYAGYEETGVDLIFTGDIVNAIPTTPPDVVLQCKAITGYFNIKTPKNITLTGNVSTSTVAQSCAETLGLKLNFDALTDKVLNGFSFSGNSQNVVNELESIGGYDVFCDDETLNVIEKGKGTKGEVKLVSEKTGMIGMPKPDAIGVEVTTLLDNKIKVGGTIRLESTQIPSCSGYYIIYELKYNAQLRGKEFYTTIKSRRANI